MVRASQIKGAAFDFSKPIPIGIYMGRTTEQIRDDIRTHYEACPCDPLDRVKERLKAHGTPREAQIIQWQSRLMELHGHLEMSLIPQATDSPDYVPPQARRGQERGGKRPESAAQASMAHIAKTYHEHLTRYADETLPGPLRSAARRNALDNLRRMRAIQREEGIEIPSLPPVPDPPVRPPATSKAKRQRDQRTKWLKEGKCTRCGHERDRPNLFICASCTKKIGLQTGCRLVSAHPRE